VSGGVDVWIGGKVSLAVAKVDRDYGVVAIWVLSFDEQVGFAVRVDVADECSEDSGALR
jgi:hypothetical protein